MIIENLKLHIVYTAMQWRRSPRSRAKYEIQQAPCLNTPRVMAEIVEYVFIFSNVAFNRFGNQTFARNEATLSLILNGDRAKG